MKTLKIQLEVLFFKPCQECKELEQIVYNAKKQTTYVSENLLLPAHRCHFFSRSLFSPLSALFLPLHSLCLQTPLQERKRAREGVPNTDTFPPPPPPLSLKTTAVIPNACQRATELDSVYICVRTCGCLCSLWTGQGYTLYTCWLWFLLSTAKKFWNTLYKAKKVAWGSLWFRYPKRESKSCPGADSNCIPLYPSLC